MIDLRKTVQRNWREILVASLAACVCFVLLDVLVDILLFACMQTDSYLIISFSRIVYRGRHVICLMVCLMVLRYLFIKLRAQVISAKVVLVVLVVACPAVFLMIKRAAVCASERMPTNDCRIYEFSCWREGVDISIKNENIKTIYIDENGPECCLMSIFLSDTGKKLIERMKEGDGSSSFVIYIDGKRVAEVPMEKVSSNFPLQFSLGYSCEDQRVWNLMDGMLRGRMRVEP